MLLTKANTLQRNVGLCLSNDQQVAISAQLDTTLIFIDFLVLSVSFLPLKLFSLVSGEQS